MKIITWNVNGYRSADKKGSIDEIMDLNPDIICFQEIKMNEELFNKPGYFCYYNFAIKKGYSGVMICTKEKPINIKYIIGDERFDSEGRLILLEYKDYTILDLYVPQGGREKQNLQYKLESIDKIISLTKEYKNLIICTDFNIAHTELDVLRYKNNKNNIMFTQEERDKVTELLSNDLTDSFRYLDKDSNDIFSWWPNGFNARERNIGWRIDYIFVSNNLNQNIKSVQYLKSQYGSDHCPLLLELNIK